MSEPSYNSFAEVRARLDEIVLEVKDKELSLEKSLDLYEEAIRLGNRCAELVDKPDFAMHGLDNEDDPAATDSSTQTVESADE